VSQYYPFFTFVLIAVFFWMLLIRPARRRQAQLKETQSSLEYGTEVMLGAGIYGRVVGFDENTINLEVSPGTTMKVARAAIVRVVEPPANDDV